MCRLSFDDFAPFPSHLCSSAGFDELVEVFALMRLVFAFLCCMAIDWMDVSLDVHGGSMIMEFVCWKTCSGNNQMSGECQRELKGKELKRGRRQRDRNQVCGNLYVLLSLTLGFSCVR